MHFPDALKPTKYMSPEFLPGETLAKLRTIFKDVKQGKRLKLSHCQAVQAILAPFNTGPADIQFRARVEAKAASFSEKEKSGQLVEVFKEVVAFLNEVRERQNQETAAITQLKDKKLRKLNKEEVSSLAHHFDNLTLAFQSQTGCNKFLESILKRKIELIIQNPEQRNFEDFHQLINDLNPHPKKTEAPIASPFEQNYQNLKNALEKFRSDAEKIRGKVASITPETYSEEEVRVQTVAVNTLEKAFEQIENGARDQQGDLADEILEFTRSTEKMDTSKFETIEQFIEYEKLGESVQSYANYLQLQHNYNSINLLKEKETITKIKHEIEKISVLIKNVCLLIKQINDDNFQEIFLKIVKVLEEANIHVAENKKPRESLKKIAISCESAKPWIKDYKNLLLSLKDKLEQLKKNSSLTIIELQAFQRGSAQICEQMEDLYYKINRLNILEELALVKEELDHSVKMVNLRFSMKELEKMLEQCKEFFKFKEDHKEVLRSVRNLSKKKEDGDRYSDEISSLTRSAISQYSEEQMQKERSLDAQRIQLVGLNQNTLIQIAGQYPHLHSAAKPYFDALHKIAMSIDVTKSYAPQIFEMLQNITNKFIERLNSKKITGNYINELNTKLREQVNLDVLLTHQLEFLKHE